MKDSSRETFINPIDIDKVAENPGLLPYAHEIGSAVIRPEDMGKVKGRSMSAMYEQSQLQLSQIREQIELLARQAQNIKNRIVISNQIYDSKYSFEPLVSHTYYLYQKEEEQRVLSMVGPNEWGRNPPFLYLATVKLLADHTWDVLHQNEEIDAFL